MALGGGSGGACGTNTLMGVSRLKFQGGEFSFEVAFLF